MPNLTLHPLWHSAMPVYERAIGVGTLCFSGLAFHLMITKTPKGGQSFVKYLMLLQASITLTDVNYGFLSCPISLFPLPGGLCNGILCTWFGLSGHVGNSIMFFTLTLVAISVFYCFHYKHVSIGRMVGAESRTDTQLINFRIFVFVIYAIPCLFQTGRYRYLKSGPLYVKNNFPSLYYLFENPSYRAYAYDNDLFPMHRYMFLAVTLFTICLASVTILCIVAIMFYRLFKQNSLSEKTRRMQQQTLVILIVQTLPPIAMQMMPILIYTCSLITDTLTPDINNGLICFQQTHALFHTSILILSTPSYREACMFWHRKKNSVASLYSQR